MLSNIKRRMRKDEEEGFTLIELLVVVLILGILMAIAIPTFLSLTGGAKTSAAEADLTTAAQDESSYLTQNGSFDSASTVVATAQTDNLAAMKLADTGINWVSTTPLAAGTKSVAIIIVANGAASTVPTLFLVTKGSDTNEYWIKDTNGTLTYAQTTSAVAFTTSGPAVGDFVSGWSSLAAAAPQAT